MIGQLLEIVLTFSFTSYKMILKILGSVDFATKIPAATDVAETK